MSAFALFFPRRITAVSKTAPTWAAKRAKPAAASFKIMPPTVPRINRGEDSEQKPLILYASLSEIRFLAYSSAVILLPPG